MSEEKYIGKAKMKEQPSKSLLFKLKEKSVFLKHLANDVLSRINKVDDLQNQIDSLEQHGIAISNEFGNNPHIGISQRTLTNVIGRMWEVLGEIKEKNYMDFKLTVNPEMSYQDTGVSVSIVADSRESIGYFDSIKIYVDDVLITEGAAIDILNATVVMHKTSQIKAVGVILSKTVTKEKTFVKRESFFMGSAVSDYHDVMVSENWREIQGTLEGDYDLVVKNNGESMFIIIPASRKNEFRRANLMAPDMNGFEIPLEIVEDNEDYVVYKSKAEEGYKAGTYNIDININS